MDWPVNSITDDARVKWNTAMKFLIPSKFDVNRAIDLYITHEVNINITLKNRRYLNDFLFRLFVKLKILIKFG